MPKVSIGLPVYNGEKYLREMLESALAQTYEDIEIVICDNASTDGTMDICAELAKTDGRIRYIRNAENIGACPNYNRTFQESTGEYFAWAAHDDRYAPTFIEKCVEVLDTNQDMALVYTGIELIDGSGMTLRYDPARDGYVDSVGTKIQMKFDPMHIAESVHAENRFRDVLHRVSWCTQVFGMSRRALMARTQLQRSYYGSDKVYLAELALLGRYQQIEDPLFIKRVHRDISFFLSVNEKRQWVDTKSCEKSVPQALMVRDYLSAIYALGPRSVRGRLHCYLTVALMARRHGLWSRIFVPGPDNYLGIDFGSVRTKSGTSSSRKSEPSSGPIRIEND